MRSYLMLVSPRLGSCNSAQALLPGVPKQVIEALGKCRGKAQRTLEEKVGELRTDTPVLSLI